MVDSHINPKYTADHIWTMWKATIFGFGSEAQPWARAGPGIRLGGAGAAGVPPSRGVQIWLISAWFKYGRLYIFDLYKKRPCGNG